MRAGPALPMSPHPKGPLSEAEQACPGVPTGGGRRPRQGSPAVGSRGLRADLCVTAQQGSGQVPKPRQACLLVHVGTTRTAGGSRGEVLGAGGRTPPRASRKQTPSGSFKEGARTRRGAGEARGGKEGAGAQGRHLRSCSHPEAGQGAGGRRDASPGTRARRSEPDAWTGAESDLRSGVTTGPRGLRSAF